MTKELQYVRKHVIPKLLKNPMALPFKYPVDAITEGIFPDYFMVRGDWVLLSFFIIEFLNLVKFVMYTLVSRVHMAFYILTKGYTVPGNQGTK